MSELQILAGCLVGQIDQWPVRSLAREKLLPFDYQIQLTDLDRMPHGLTRLH